MMSGQYSRMDRVSDALLRDIAQLIQRHMSDPRVSLVTLSSVRISRDLSEAKVFFTLMQDDQSATEVARILNGASGFLRRLLSQKSVLYRVPRLQFIYDECLVRANQVTALIDRHCRE